MATLSSIDHLADLESALARDFGLTKGKTHEILVDFQLGLKAIMAQNVKDPKFRLVTKLGIFKSHQAKAKPGRNPATGETIQIPAKSKIVFKPTKDLADAGL